MIFLRVLLWILLSWKQLGMNTVNGQCEKGSYFHCKIGIVNMTTDGGPRLRKAFESGLAVQIEKMIVSISPSGPFLQRFASMIDSVSYALYREPAFHVPDGNTIDSIFILNAPVLRAFVAGLNTYLTMLRISQCPLDRLPSTIPQLTRLEFLTITECKLVALRLDMLGENQNLNHLSLAYNQIRQIIPVRGQPAKKLAITKLWLPNNLLEHLDMAMLVFLPELVELDVRQNLIVTLDASARVTLPKLARVEMRSNKITSCDLRNLTLPSLDTISLNQNALQRMPSLPKSLPKLVDVLFDRNNLTQLDLSYFRSYTSLTRITLSENRISVVRTSSPVRLAVKNLSFDNNLITSFNITGLDMPNITTLSLSNNRFKVVPPIFDRYPNILLAMYGNPLTCNALLPFKDKLKEYRLIKDQIPASMDCSTTSSFMASDAMKVCCDN